MALDVIDAVLQVTEALRQVYLQQIPQQVLQVRAKMRGEANLEESRDNVSTLDQNNRIELTLCFNAHLPRDDLFVDLNGLVGKEGRVTGSHFINEHTQSPPVYCFIITLRETHSRKVTA